MPSNKSRAAADDSQSETSTTKERSLGSLAAAANGKARRGPNNPAAASSLRDVTTLGNVESSATAAVPASASAPGANAAQDSNSGIQWSSFDDEVLQAYRHAYRLNTPAAFQSSYSQLLLSRPGIGRMSPTMARRKEQRRQSKEQLANACRKHFNGLGIQENEVVVDFLYKVRWQDKNFRMHFAPQRPR